MRVIRAHLGPAALHDVRHLTGTAIYDPEDYTESQQLGDSMRRTNSFGVHYQSVRTYGECIGVMRPRILSDAIHWRYLRYHYNKGVIVEVVSLGGNAGRTS